MRLSRLSHQFFKDKWDETTCTSSDIQIKKDVIIQYNEAKGLAFIQERLRFGN